MRIAVVGSHLTAALEDAVRAWGGRDAAVERADRIVLAPGLDGGWDRVRRWRSLGVTAPVLVVGGPALPEGSRALLEPVAYVAQSATVAQLQGAWDHLERRAAPPPVALSHGAIDFVRRAFVPAAGAEVPLTQRELDLVAFFAARPFVDHDRETLLREVWGHRAVTATRAVDMAMSRLRRKLELDVGRPAHLLASRGGGYRFHPPIAAPAVTGGPGVFVGRGQERARLAALLGAEGARVLVVGPPGVGKSRLVREVVSATPGALWVELGHLEPWTTAVAGALGVDVSHAPDTELATRLLALRLAESGVRTLVVDGARERLNPPVPAVRGLRVVVTSRLHQCLSGADTVDLAPLSADDAGALLIARAGEVGAEVLEDVSPAVRRLDGLPLAIELAARRLRTRSVAELVDGLDDRFRLLTDRGGTRLDAAIASSWEGLDLAARAGLAGVARLGGPIPAALARAAAGGEEALDALVAASLVTRRPTPEGPEFAMLDTLREWARAHAGPPPDERALLTEAAAYGRRVSGELAGRRGRVAAAALSRADRALWDVWALAVAAGATEQVDVALALDRHHDLHAPQDARARHLDAFVAGAPPELRAPLHLRRAWARLELDRHAAVDDDLRAARDALPTEVALLESRRAFWLGQLSAAAAHLDAVPPAALAELVVGSQVAAERAALTQLAHGSRGVGEALAELGRRVEALVAADRLDVASNVLYRMATLSANAGLDREGRRVADQLKALADLVPHQRDQARAANTLAWQRIQAGDYDEAATDLAASARLLRALGHHARLAYVHDLLAYALVQAGRHEEAKALIEEMLADTVRGQERAHALEVHALWFLDTGDPEGALDAAEEGLAAVGPTGDAILAALLQLHRAVALGLLGRTSEAWDAVRAVRRDVLPRDHLASALAFTAVLARAAGHADEAEGAARALRALLRGPRAGGFAQLESWLRGDEPRRPRAQTRVLSRLSRQLFGPPAQW